MRLGATRRRCLSLRKCKGICPAQEQLSLWFMPQGHAGRKAIATNDGADTGLYIATGPVGGPGQSWQKVGP